MLFQNHVKLELSLLERNPQQEKIETKGNEVCCLGALSTIWCYGILTFYSSIKHLLEKGSLGTMVKVVIM